jgi:methyltransferase (TIGR00027 family)
VQDAECRTAALVCAGRAAAHGRTPAPAFDDPTAAVLLPDEWRDRVAAYRAATAPPDGVGARTAFVMLRTTEALMVPRTVAIDDAIRAMRPRQVVNLGAGLDGRPWRLAELADAVVLEVDHPASQAAKRQRAAALTPCAREIRFVAVDFTRDDLGARLAEEGHDPAVPTLWISEGVVSYLTAAQIVATFATAGARSAPGSVVALSYLSPSLGSRLGRIALRAILRRGGGDVFEHEPHRSALRPDAVRALLARHGFAGEDDRDLVTIARAIGADTRHMGGFPRAGRVAVARRG